MKPANELVQGGTAYMLASEGKCYAAYLPTAQRITLNPPSGEYTAKWFNPRTGDYVPIAGDISGGTWHSPEPPGPGDWAIVLKAK
jgi:hypothetical protein